MAVEQVETAAAAPKTGSKMTQYSKTGKMVMEAIETLNEKKGSSIIKIRNYITTQNPEIDMARYGKLVKKFILSSLEKGDLTNNDDTKGIRGYFKIAPELKKKNKKALKKLESSEKSSTSKGKSSTTKEKSSKSKEKGSKTASSPKVKKPVSKTVKLPSAVVATTIKKKKSTKASSAEAEKEQATKTKKKATAGTKRGKKTEDEAPVPKKKSKKEAEKPKAKAKPKPKKAKSVDSESDAKADEPEEAVNDVSEVDENVEPEETVVEKVARGKGKKTEAKKPKKVAAKKNKAAKVDDDNKEE